MWTSPDAVVYCLINVIYILMSLIQFGGFFPHRKKLPYWKTMYKQRKPVLC